MRRPAHLAFLIGTSCGTTLSSLKKPTQEQSFTLSKAYPRIGYHEKDGPKFVEGLQAGTYRLIGEDETSLYFMGEGDCVIALHGELAERYLATGVVPSYQERCRYAVDFTGGAGGLRVPRPGSEAKASLFFLLRVSPAPASTGIAGAAMVAMLPRDEMVPILFDSEQQFLGSLRFSPPLASSPAPITPGTEATVIAPGAGVRPILLTVIMTLGLGLSMGASAGKKSNPAAPQTGATVRCTVRSADERGLTRVVLDGPCTFRPEGKNGSFSLAALDGTSPLYPGILVVSVNLAAQGEADVRGLIVEGINSRWGDARRSKADPACWTGSDFEVCARRKK